MMQREMSTDLLNYREWPAVDEHSLPDKLRERFSRLKSAVEACIDGVKSSEIQKRFGVSNQYLHYLLSRCAAIHFDGRPWGYRSLRKYQHQIGYTRKKAPKACEGTDGKGLSGSWSQLVVRNETVRTLIFKAIEPAIHSNTKEAGLNIAALHGRIIRALADAGWTEYPMATKNMGYVALTKFIKKLIAAGHAGAAESAFGGACFDALQAMTNKHGLMRPRRAFDVVCYDEQTLPFIGTIEIEIDGVPIEVPLHRCYLCLMVDEKSFASLGYQVTIDDRIRARDLLCSYEMALTPWQPKVLSVSTLSYLPGAGLPSGVVPEAQGRRIRILKLDNHLTHYAQSVTGHLRSRAGVILTFGRVRHWISRHVVEGLFAELQKRGFRRLPSTTGTGPTDPAVANPVGKAIERKMRWDDLLELIDVLLANHNAIRRRGLKMKTPNETIGLDFAPNSSGSVVPLMSSERRSDPQIAVEVIKRIVRGSRKRGRRPYVQIDGARYTSDLLSESWAMVGKPLHLHVRGDFRKVRAFLITGEEFGPLEVEGHWGMEFHTRQVRQEINRLHREDVLKRRCQGDDVANYMDHLARQATHGKRGKQPPKLSSSANRLAAALRDAGETMNYTVRNDVQHPDAGLTLDGESAKQSADHRDFFSNGGEQT